MPEFVTDQHYNTIADSFVPKSEYLLSPEEMDEIESELFSELEPHLGSDDMVTVVVPWDSKYAKFGRTSETWAYGDFDNHAEMVQYEQNSFFIYTYDTEHGRIAHVKRILHAKTPEERDATGLTGVEVIDDRIVAQVDKEKAELDELMAYHDIPDIEQCWNVTSNHRTNRVNANFLERPFVLASYKTVFELGRRSGVTRLFAYLNEKAINSLAGENMQIEYQLLGGEEYHLPLPNKPGMYDEDFVATCLPYTPANMSKFTEVDETAIGTVLIADRDVPIYSVAESEGVTEITRI